MAAARFILALVTAPDLKTARKIVAAALKAKLAACANLVPKVESHYWWQGKMEKTTEALIVFKTTHARMAALEKCVLANHPYDTPEFIALPITAGNPRYLGWLASSVKTE